LQKQKVRSTLVCRRYPGLRIYPLADIRSMSR